MYHHLTSLVGRTLVRAEKSFYFYIRQTEVCPTELSLIGLALLRPYGIPLRPRNDGIVQSGHSEHPAGFVKKRREGSFPHGSFCLMQKILRKKFRLSAWLRLNIFYTWSSRFVMMHLMPPCYPRRTYIPNPC